MTSARMTSKSIDAAQCGINNVMLKIPSRVLFVSVVLGALRLLAFWFINSSVRHDAAQWQLAYVPLFLADLPVSAGYIFLRIPYPYAEAIIGPFWWFMLPITVWKVRSLMRKKPIRNDA
jgi:hypothetical protein